MITHLTPNKMEIARAQQNELRKVLTDLINSDENPERLMELYYWSREPGAVNVMRAFVSMPEISSEAVRAFVDLTPDPGSIVAKMTRSGRLILTAAPVAQVLAMAHYMTAVADAARTDRPALAAGKYPSGKRKLAAA